MDSVASHPPLVRAARPNLDERTRIGNIVSFFGLLAAGLLYTGYSLYSDINEAAPRTTTWLPFLLLAVALLVALGFEFVNGFHDTANAVATVIYTHALPPQFAVIVVRSLELEGNTTSRRALDGRSGA